MIGRTRLYFGVREEAPDEKKKKNGQWEMVGTFFFFIKGRKSKENKKVQ